MKSSHRHSEHPWRELGLIAVSLVLLISTFRITADNARSSRSRQLSGGSGSAASAATRTRLAESYGSIPLSFEVNRGQTSSEVKFISRGSGYSLFLTPAKAVLVLAKKAQPKDGTNGLATRGRTRQRITSTVSELVTLQMSLDGADQQPEVLGFDELPGKVNYLLGNDPSKWHTDIPTFAKVRYRNIYPGIDLVYYGKDRQLEYDFAVSPGSDPRQIGLSFKGATNVELNADGDAVVQTPGGNLRLHRPVMYQDLKGRRQVINGRFIQSGGDQLRFEVGEYDAKSTLVIDPVLSYSTYLGGGSEEDSGNSITVDASDNAYIVGNTRSINFPTANAAQPFPGGGADPFGLPNLDGFITKLNSTGNGLVYSTYLGGNKNDSANAIALASDGSAVVVGDTSSPNFPTSNALQSSLRGTGDAFVAKLSPAGNSLVFSTYFGGDAADSGRGVTLDTTSNVYLSGNTNSSNFPTASAFQTSYAGGTGCGDAFVSKLNVAGSAVIYSSYLGGSGEDCSNDIGLDSLNNLYLTGRTSSGNFPTINALQPSHGGGSAGSTDAFVTKVSSSGSSLVYSTFLGGNDTDRGSGIAVDPSGNAYVVGTTASLNFPTASPFQPAHGGGSVNIGPGDAFVTKINSSGTAFVYSTFLGGNNHDGAADIAVNASGSAIVLGETFSPNFPVVDSIQSFGFINQGELFVAKFSPIGAALEYSTLLGGNDEDSPASLALDTSGNAYLTGNTWSDDFPRANPFQNFQGGGLFGQDAFVAKISDVSGHRISGQVKDAGNKPIVNTTLTLSGSLTGTVTTDANGDYSFPSLAPGGNFTITPSKQFHTFDPPSQTFNNLSGDQTADFTGASFNVTISGRVLNGLGGGVSSVTVTLSGSQSSSVQTDGTGNYSFSSLPAGGNYTITPSRGTDTFNPPSKTFNNLGSNQTADFTLVYRISGKVLDGSGVGMAAVDVNLTGSQTATVKTDSGGNYSFLNLPSNVNYTVTPVKAGYTLTYLFNPSSRSYTNLSANQTGDFSLTGTSTLVFLNLIADAFVEDGSSAAINFGIDESLKLQTRTQGPNRDAYFKVDLTSVTRSINSAKLSFYAATSTSSSLTTSAYPVTTTTWIESGTGGITWNNKPARGTAISGASVAVAGTTYAAYLIDVTPYIKSEKAAGRNVVSFALHDPSSSTSFITLNSREALTNKPQLVVTTSNTNNANPTVTITSPAGGASYVAPATIPIVTTATDSDGTVSKVEFYAGTSLLGTNTQPDSGTTNRYTLNWSNVGLGSYSLTAIATDDSGSTGSSVAVGVTVLSPNVPPAVTFVSPITGAVFSDGSSIGLTANASDLDGSISKVEFFDSSTLIGTATIPSPPGTFAVAWNNASAGVHSLTAKATDNVLGTTTTSAVSINVVRQTALLPTADAYVADGASASSNFGTALDLQSQLPSSGTGNKESYLKFDLTSVSAIVRARLRLYGNLTSGSNVPNAVHSVSNTAWTETGITWNNKPAGTNPPLSTTTISGSTSVWNEWDITAFIQTEKAAGHNTVSLVLKSTAVGASTFNSREAASSRPQLVIDTTASKTTLLVGGSNSPSSSDSAIQTRLQGLGYTVTYKRDSSSVTADADGKALVLISASVAPASVNTKFRNVPIPVINCESDVFDDFGMTGTVSGTDFGTATAQTQVAIVNASHPMAAGLAGSPGVVSTASSFTWAKPNANATTVATLTTDATKVTLFGYENGLLMTGLNAPARRLGLFLSDTTSSSLNTNGWALFDAAAKWAVEISVAPTITSLTPQLGLAGTSVTVSGANFGTSQGTSTITFGSIQATPTSWNPTSIVTVVPAGAETGPVVVTVKGVNSNSMVFTVGEADTDGDGLPDSWEIFYFGNLNQLGTGDPDGDGKTNLVEYQQGRSPNVSEVPDSGNVINLKVFTPLD